MSLEASLLAGAALSLGAASPAEWAIHKYMLHARKRNWLTRRPAISHNDIHHGGYRAPHHYYRDVTNEDIIIHFSPQYVGLIAGIATAVGAGIATVHNIASSGKQVGIEDVLFAGGVVGGTMAYYGAYEFTHHYMHVIGRRRMAINNELGNALQGGKADDMLRFSKPLLDDICNAMEKNIDRGMRSHPQKYDYDPALVKRLDDQIRINADREPFGKLVRPHMERMDAYEALQYTTDIMISLEEKWKSGMTKWGRAKYWLERKVQSVLRNSKMYEYIDNHHFLHHFRYLKNLNVVWPLMDKLAGTKVDSSREMLEKDTNFWLCPNTTDKNKFDLN